MSAPDTPRSSPDPSVDDRDALRTVHRTAALARLSIDPDEERKLAGDFARILASFHALSEVDDAPGDAPGEGADSSGEGDAVVPRRADEPAPFAETAALLDAAPQPIDASDGGDDAEAEGRFFGVPKTLGGPE